MEQQQERVYTKEETFQYYYNKWKALGFSENPNIDEGIYCDMVELQENHPHWHVWSLLICYTQFQQLY